MKAVQRLFKCVLRPRVSVYLLVSILGITALACEEADRSSNAANGESETEVMLDQGPSTEAFVAPATKPAQWRCSYSNPFSLAAECKAYTDTDWTEAEARADCEAGQYEEAGTFESGNCDLSPILGYCDVAPYIGDDYRLFLGGDNPDLCNVSGRACVVNLKGEFLPSEQCVDRYSPPEMNMSTSSVFEWPTLSCQAPPEGEQSGQSENGEVCTWNLISGCTEAGRDYYEYGSCDTVYTNRPYYPVPGLPAGDESDPRYSDEIYQQESNWVKEQVKACACVCCHDDRAPRGPSTWSVDAGPLWVNTMSDTAVAMFAGYIDSSSLGAFMPEENNGFDRIQSAMPTTDVQRMLAFFQAEFDRRNIDPAWAENVRPIGGPLVTQRDYQPEACATGIGVNREGVINWGSEQGVRYLYILEEDANNPGIPPNFDLPEKTLWRIDIPSDQDPLASGTVRYGEKPSQSIQVFPETQAPQALEEGQQYYLYVMRDVAIPVERCVFTY